MSIHTPGLERAIERLGAVLSICFLVIALGLGYWGLARAPALVERDDNPRRIEDERRIRRGYILDRQRKVLVRSDPGNLGTWRRVYVIPETAPVVGYYSINYGTGGIERAFDADIRGERALNAVEQIQADLLHLHSTGVSVTLTIDLNLQQMAYQALDHHTGAVVLLDARNGDILAMASQPTFDPNTLEQDWPQLQNAPEKPLLNRAAQGLYLPGSIFQTITLAAAIEKGLAEPQTIFTDTLGVVLTVDPPISCPDDLPQTRFTLAEAYTWPCSVLFARLGLALGGEQLADYATRLGIGLPLDLPIEAARGQLLARGVWSNLLAARTAMGQGEVLVTPLEMALMAATIAAEGIRPVPRLVLTVGNDQVVPPAQPKQALEATTARHVQTIMAQTLARNHPDGTWADAGGQASSAQSGRAGAPPHAWFVGFAPLDRPRYAIAVIVEYGEDGWQVAAPIGLRILARAITQ